MRSTRLAATLACCAAAVAPTTSQAAFQPAQEHPATADGSGFGGATIAAAELTGDAHVDLAVIDSSGGGVAIVAGRGDGGFGAPRFEPTGQGANSVAAADLNGDGRTDLSVTSLIPGGLTVLLAQAEGSFTRAGTAPTGLGPQGVTAADLNGDGRTDLAVANGGSGSVSVLLGTGDGSFSRGGDVPAGVFTSAIASADFDRDGAPDLAAGNGIVGSDVQVLLGDGRGAFPRRASYPAARAHEGMAVADLNADGAADITVAAAAGENVPVLIGRGDGTFHPAAEHPAGGAAGSIAAADFDLDGKPDLAVALLSGSVAILRGDGAGGFERAEDHAVGGDPQSLVAADLNGDAAPDLALAHGGEPYVSVLLNASRPAPSPAPRLHLAVRPDQARAGERTAFRFRVSADGQPVSGATVRFERRTVKTNQRGRAVMRLAPRRVGLVRARANKTGFESATARVRILGPRGRGTSRRGPSETVDAMPPDTVIDSGPSGTTGAGPLLPVEAGPSPRLPAQVALNGDVELEFQSTEAGSRFECRLDGGEFAPCASPQEYRGLADGEHTFEVRATDPAGNTDATPARRTFTVAASAASSPALYSLRQVVDLVNGSQQNNGIEGGDQTEPFGANPAFMPDWDGDGIFGGQGDFAIENSTQEGIEAPFRYPCIALDGSVKYRTDTGTCAPGDADGVTFLTGRARKVRVVDSLGWELAATIFLPREALNDPVPKLPGVVIADGFRAAMQTFYMYSMTLAERGFIVLSFDFAGQGQSEDNTDEGSTHAFMGSGVDMCRTPRSCLETQDMVRWFAGKEIHRNTDRTQAPFQGTHDPAYEDGGGDNPRNPVLPLLDTSRIGLMGQSQGATTVGNYLWHLPSGKGADGHPLPPIAAAVALSGFAPAHAIVPYQLQTADLDIPGPGLGEEDIVTDGPVGTEAYYEKLRGQRKDSPLEMIVLESGSHGDTSSSTRLQGLGTPFAVWSWAVSTGYAADWMDCYLQDRAGSCRGAVSRRPHISRAQPSEYDLDGGAGPEPSRCIAVPDRATVGQVWRPDRLAAGILGDPRYDCTP